MAGKLNCYDLGGGGVNLTKGPYHNADNEVLRSQNAELVLDRSTGGEGVLAKRGGYVYLNPIALAGAIVGMAEVRFIASLPSSFESNLIAEFSQFTTGTIAAVGAATTWEASNVDDAAYTEFVNASNEGGNIYFTADPLADPGAGATYVLHVILRSTGDPGAGVGIGVTVQVYDVGAGIPYGLLYLDQTDLLANGNVFTEYTATLSGVDAGNFYAGAGYADFQMFCACVADIGGSLTTGVDRVWLEVIPA